MMIAAASDASNETFFLIYVVLWAILGGGGYFYVKNQPTAALRRLWWKRYSIGFGIFVFLSMMEMTALNGQLGTALPFFLIAAPFTVFIMWSNIRNKYFCDSCGKRRKENPFSIKRISHCPYCGERYAGETAKER